MMRKDTDAQKSLNELKAGATWAELAKRLDMNKGYLSRVAKGQRPASNNLRVKLGLPPHTVAVEPLPCGHAPSGKRCPVCQPHTPRRQYDISYKRLRQRIASLPFSVEIRAEIERSLIDSEPNHH